MEYDGGKGIELSIDQFGYDDQETKEYWTVLDWIGSMDGWMALV